MGVDQFLINFSDVTFYGFPTKPSILAISFISVGWSMMNKDINLDKQYMQVACTLYTVMPFYCRNIWLNYMRLKLINARCNVRVKRNGMYCTQGTISCL